MYFPSYIIQTVIFYKQIFKLDFNTDQPFNYKICNALELLIGLNKDLRIFLILFVMVSLGLMLLLMETVPSIGLILISQPFKNTILIKKMDINLKDGLKFSQELMSFLKLILFHMIKLFKEVSPIAIIFHL